MGKKGYTGRDPGGNRRPGKSGSTHNVRSMPLGGGGGSGGTGSGSRHRGGTRSSSVHDSIRILVVGMASGALLLVGSPVAYLVWSGVTGS